MILLKAQVESVATRKDRTIKLSFSTQELRGKDAAELLDLQNELVSLGISPKGLGADEIALLQENKFGLEDVPNEKSASQRLRSVLYIAFTQDSKDFKTFQDYYTNKMESIINFYKEKLD